MLVISNLDKKIMFLSNCYTGTVHDFSILKAEFPSQYDWFKDHEIRLDLGFKGFADLYGCKKLYIPNKKPRKTELSEELKLANKEQASQRVVVEHSIGGLKRYRILSERLRTHCPMLYDKIAGVCAGLWNFNLM
jgi:hypothetical protein